MAIASTDLIAYNCANKPDDDVSTGGGAIDLDYRPTFTQLAASDNLEAFSSSAADTGTLTITGRATTGVIQQTTIVLNGTSTVTNANTFERILSVSNSGDANGTITVRRSPAGATVCTIPAGERGVYALFKRSASESGITIRYDKIFWRNAHAGLTLQSAKAQLSADPDSRIRVGIATSVGDSATIANRKTAPAGITFVDDGADQSLPGSALAAGANVGQWIELNLPAADSPHKTTFTSQISGTSI